MKGLILTWLLTFLGVTGCVITPFYGLLVYVALALLRPDFLWSHSINGGRFSLIVAIAMLLSWGLRGFGRWDFGRGGPVVLLFTAFWLWSVFGAMYADSPTHAWYYVDQMGKILLPFLIGVTSVRSVSDLKLLAWVIVICEGYVCFEMNMHYFGGFNYLWAIGFGGVDNNSAAIGFVTALGVAAFLFLHEEVWWKRCILIACGAFIAHAIQFSFSRGAMLATGVLGVAAWIVIRNKTFFHYSIFGLAAVALIGLAGPEVHDRFWQTFSRHDGQHEESAQSRLDLWADCAVVIARSPVMGCGPDHWPLIAHTFGWEKGKEAHSLWVQTAAETGIPGIIMFMGFYVVCMWRCWITMLRLKPDDHPWYRDSCRLTIASLCGFGVAAQFVSLEALEVPYYVALLGTGTLVLYSREQKQHRRLAEQQLEQAPDPDVPCIDWRDTVGSEVTCELIVDRQEEEFLIMN